MKQQILVIGGTGKTGSRIVKLLNEQGHIVRVGSRSGNPAFDWHKPEGWSEVLEGIQSVYITYQPDLAVPGALEAIEELVKHAKRANVKRLVLLSGKGEREAQLCEQVVIHSGLQHTIVRANWFNQNFSENFLLEPILQGDVALPYANVKIPFVDVNDIAEVAVKALTEDGHNGKIYELTGSETLTFEEAIREIARAAARDIQFTGISVSAYIDALRSQEIPEDFLWLIEYLFTEVLGNPANAEITNDIQKVLNRKPISFRAYVAKTTATGIWSNKAKQLVL